MNPFKLKSTEGFCSGLAKRARQGKVLALALSLTAITSYIVYAQSRGIPSQLRVKIDATGALAVSSAGITNPTTTTVFTNARLKTDASGNLVVTDGSGAGFAPANGTYIVKTTNASLPSAQSLGALTTGILLNTVSGSTGTLSSLSSILSFANGGFGFATATTGDLFYASATNTPNKLAAVASGSVLCSNGIAMAFIWCNSPSITALTLSGNLAAASQQITGTSTFNANDNNLELVTPSTGQTATLLFYDGQATPKYAWYKNTTNKLCLYSHAAVNDVLCVTASSLNLTFNGTPTAPTFNATTSITNTNATNGQTFSDLQTLTELTTIAAAATTDTTIQMPANSVVLGVTVRVTTVIPTCATFTVGDSGSAARFSTAAVSCAATSTDSGTKAAAYYNASALSIRITPNAQPANNSGRVRVTIYYYTVTPSTS